MVLKICGSPKNKSQDVLLGGGGGVMDNFYAFIMTDTGLLLL